MEEFVYNYYNERKIDTEGEIFNDLRCSAIYSPILYTN